MPIVLIFLAALVALALMPGWKSFGVISVAIVVFLVVIFMDQPVGPCSGHAECGGQMAGYLMKGPIMMAFWLVFLIVAALKTWRLSVVLTPPRRPPPEW